VDARARARVDETVAQGATSHRIEGWLRTLADPLAAGLRREWSRLREPGKDELTLDAIQRLVALEALRGGKGA